MNKLIGNNSSKKLRVLKYSLLASISVGSITAIPLEGVAIGNKSASLESLNREDHYKSINKDSYIERQKNRPKRSKSLGRTPSTKKVGLDQFNDQNLMTENEYTSESISKQKETVVKITYKKVPKNSKEIISPTSVSKVLTPFQLQQAKNSAAIQGVVDRNKLSGDEVRSDREKNAELIKQRKQSEINQFKTKTNKELKNEQKNAEMQVIKQSIAQQMRQISSINNKTLETQLQDLETQAVNISEEVNNKLKYIKKQPSKERAILLYELKQELQGKRDDVAQIYNEAIKFTAVDQDNPGAKAEVNNTKNILKQYDDGLLLVPKHRKNNNEKSFSLLAEPDPKLKENLKHLNLKDNIAVIEDQKNTIEEQYFTARNQNLSASQLYMLALKALNLSVRESQLEQARTEEPFEQKPVILKPVLNTKPLTEINTLERELKGLITDPNKAPKKNLAYLDLEYTKETQKKKEEQYFAIFNENPNDPKLEELALAVLNLDVEQSDLEQKIQALRNEAVQNNSIPQIIVTPPNDEPIYAIVNKDKKRANSKVILETDKENSTELPKTSTPKQQLAHADSVESISDLIGSTENLDQEFEELVKSEGLDNNSDLITSDISGSAQVEDISVQSAGLTSGDNIEEQEDEQVTGSSIQEASKSSLTLPAQNEGYYGLALSDGSEYEDSELEEEEENDNDSGIESEVEELSDLEVSDSEEEQPKPIDTVIHEEKVKEAVKSIAETPVTTNHSNKVVAMVKNAIFTTRLDIAAAIKSNEAAVAAGDDDELHIQRGLWMRGMYGTNNQGRINNVNGYKGINKGGTIGFDVEIDNNVIGIAYSNVHSLFKFKNNNNDKELIKSHVISIYGQKELPKNFVAQALVSVSRNFIKDKTTYSLGDAKFKSSVKHRNDSYNAEALLNYNHLAKNNVIITPNIGLRYGKSRDGVYNETGISVQEISLAMKENNIMAGIVGTKVRIPLKDILKVNNLGLTMHGAVEHNIKEKTQRVNRVVQILGNKFTQSYVILKQPKTSYNLGTGIVGNVKNTTISLEYNHYLNKHYRSHQGSIKLKVSL